MHIYPLPTLPMYVSTSLHSYSSNIILQASFIPAVSIILLPPPIASFGIKFHTSSQSEH